MEKYIQVLMTDAGKIGVLLAYLCRCLCAAGAVRIRIDEDNSVPAASEAVYVWEQCGRLSRIVINTHSALFSKVEEAFWRHHDAEPLSRDAADVYVGFANKGNKSLDHLLAACGDSERLPCHDGDTPKQTADEIMRIILAYMAGQ